MKGGGCMCGKGSMRGRGEGACMAKGGMLGGVCA